MRFRVRVVVRVKFANVVVRLGVRVRVRVEGLGFKV